MKVVIVMTYFNRQYQLTKTLESLKHSKHKDFEVVIVDDASTENIVHDITEYPVTVLKVKDKKWINPEPAYNMGLFYALSSRKPDIIMIQNAECYHVGDVISYTVENLTNKNYIAFSCFSLDKENTFKEHDIHRLTEEHQHKVIISGQTGWYNHPTFRPNAFDFCAAVTAPNMKKLNGYDERFSDGYAMGDCDLINRVKFKLGLNVIIPANPFVVHQWHYYEELSAEYVRMHALNAILYRRIRMEKNYKAVHKYTLDL
jgi:glycosyltransferase involved in cell wall biosynthesis